MVHCRFPKPLFFIHRLSFMVMHLFFLGLLHHRYQFHLTLFALPTHKPSSIFSHPFVHPCLIPIGRTTPLENFLRSHSLGLMVTIPVVGVLALKSTSRCTSWNHLFGSVSLKCISMVLHLCGTSLLSPRFQTGHGMISVLTFMTTLIVIGTSP